MRQISLLLFAPSPNCFPINNELIIFTSFELLIRILTHFSCSDELVCRTALLPSSNRPVVADILLLHCNHLFYNRFVPMSALHKVFLSCPNHQMKELLQNQSLEIIPACTFVLCFSHITTLSVFTCVMNARDQSRQVHAVPIRTTYRHLRTIWEQSVDNFPTDSFFRL